MQISHYTCNSRKFYKINKRYAGYMMSFSQKKKSKKKEMESAQRLGFEPGNLPLIGRSAGFGAHPHPSFIAFLKFFSLFTIFLFTIKKKINRTECNCMVFELVGCFLGCFLSGGFIETVVDPTQCGNV